MVCRVAWLALGLTLLGGAACSSDDEGLDDSFLILYRGQGIVAS